MWGLLPLYLLIDLLVLAGPFALSFHRKVSFYRNWRPVLLSLLCVSPLYIIWDAVATHRGHWSFNDDYIIGIKLAGLPLEEIMFFITIPYACLFTYEALVAFTGDKKLNIPVWPFIALAVVPVIAAFFFWGQEYTFVVLIVFSIYILVYLGIGRGLLRSSLYWRWVIITLLLFVITNIWLTAFPIVEYGSDMIWGTQQPWQGRFLTIPLEDFIYNAGMLSFYLIAYLFFKRRFAKRDEVDGKDSA